MGDILYGNAIHIREQAKIDAARITQKSGNERRASESELQRFSQALGNQRMMDAAGKNINASAENISRNLDASAYGTFSQRIAAAEELGASTADAAAAGVGGSSVELYNNTLRLNSAMQEEGDARAINSDLINASNERGEILTNAVGNLDNNIYRADLDFTKYVDHQKTSTFSKLFTLGAVAAATAVGGAKLGMAVAPIAFSAHEAGAASKNGDYATAGRETMNTLQGALNAAKTLHATADGPSKSSFSFSRARRSIIH